MEVKHANSKVCIAFHTETKRSLNLIYSLGLDEAMTKQQKERRCPPI